MVGVDVQGIADKQFSAIAVVMQHRRSGKMAAAVDERHARREFHPLAIPKTYGRIGSHYPGSVCGMDIYGTPKGVGPINHRVVKVRMRNRDCAQAADSLDEFCHSVIEQRNTVPEHIAIFPAYQERTLSNANLGIYTDADDSFALAVDSIAMPALEPSVSRPLLPMRIYGLPFIGADRAALGRFRSFGVLCAALCADVTLHCPLHISSPSGIG